LGRSLGRAGELGVCRREGSVSPPYVSISIFLDIWNSPFSMGQPSPTLLGYEWDLGAVTDRIPLVISTLIKGSKVQPNI
jgi:hypothetical protein